MHLGPWKYALVYVIPAATVAGLLLGEEATAGVG